MEKRLSPVCPRVPAGRSVLACGRNFDRAEYRAFPKSFEFKAKSRIPVERASSAVNQRFPPPTFADSTSSMRIQQSSTIFHPHRQYSFVPSTLSSQRLPYTRSCDAGSFGSLLSVMTCWRSSLCHLLNAFIILRPGREARSPKFRLFSRSSTTSGPFLSFPPVSARAHAPWPSFALRGVVLGSEEP